MYRHLIMALVLFSSLHSPALAEPEESSMSREEGGRAVAQSTMAAGGATSGQARDKMRRSLVDKINELNARAAVASLGAAPGMDVSAIVSKLNAEAEIAPVSPGPVVSLSH